MRRRFRSCISFTGRLGSALLGSALSSARALSRGVGRGGSALLGIGGTVVVSPPAGGESEAADAVTAALRLAGSDFRDSLRRSLDDVKSGMELEETKSAPPFLA